MKLSSCCLLILSPGLIYADAPMDTVQRLFTAMSSHDAAMARSCFIPGATMLAVRPDGSATVRPYEEFVDHIGKSKDAWLERIWSPQVLERQTVAVVWAEFDFHLNGKFNHCGIDSFQLLKTSEGWKIAAVADTHETSSCAPSPLGPPAGSTAPASPHP